eukprot:scaffold41963_cov67-Attheya_sp.AAC.6
MATQVTLDCLISSLRLETTDVIGERGGIPRCVAEHEWAGDPVTGTEACHQMALMLFSLDLENCQRACQVICVWKELTSCMSGVHCSIFGRCAIKDLDGEERLNKSVISLNAIKGPLVYVSVETYIVSSPAACRYLGSHVGFL